MTQIEIHWANGGVVFKEVDALLLAVAANAEPSLELHDEAVGATLAFESPGGGEDVHLGGAAHELP